MTFVGLSRRTLYTRIRNPAFPSGDKFSPSGRRRWSGVQLEEIRRLEGRLPIRNPVTDKPVVLTLCTFDRGAGKTTLSVHLAQYLAIRGYRVLLIDLDRNGAATRLLGCAGDHCAGNNDVSFGVRLLEPDTFKAATRQTHWPHLDTVPSTVARWTAESVIVGRLGEPICELQSNGVTKRFLSSSCWRCLQSEIDTVSDGYDVVLIDTPPALDLCTINALWAADALIVPLRSTVRSGYTALQFLKFLSLVLHDINQETEPLSLPSKHWDFVGLLITCSVEDSAHHDLIADKLRDAFHPFLMRNRLFKSDVIHRLYCGEMSIYDVERVQGSRELFERTLANVDKINAEIAQLVRSLWPSHVRQLAKAGS